MAVPVFPADLPPPMRAGYALASGTGVARGNATGPAPLRSMTTAVSDMVSLVFDFSRSETAVFDIFFAETTRRGLLPFVMRDHVSDGWPLLDTDGAVLTAVDGTPLLFSRTLLVRFDPASAPRRTIAGVRCRIDCSVEVLP